MAVASVHLIFLADCQAAGFVIQIPVEYCQATKLNVRSIKFCEEGMLIQYYDVFE